MKCKTAIMVIFLLVACSASAFAGCCNPGCSSCRCEPRNDFGKAYTLAVAGQILNPDAETNLEPVEGINGRAAERIMKNYVESFKPLPPSSAGGGLTSFAVTQSPGGYAH
jgi:hypothetical protein